MISSFRRAAAAGIAFIRMAAVSGKSAKTSNEKSLLDKFILTGAAGAA